MYSAILDCPACANKGRIELRLDRTPVASEAYEYLGKSVASGYFYLLCTRCKAVLPADPVGVVGAQRTETVKGTICEQGALLYNGGTNGFSDSEKPVKTGRPLV